MRPAVRDAIEQAVARGRSAEWIAGEVGVPLPDVVAVIRYMDAVVAEPGMVTKRDADRARARAAREAAEFITRVADGAALPVGSPILALRHGCSRRRIAVPA